MIDWCYLCKCDGEMVDHVLLCYSVARERVVDVHVLYYESFLGNA